MSNKELEEAFRRLDKYRPVHSLCAVAREKVRFPEYQEFIEGLVNYQTQDGFFVPATAIETILTEKGIAVPQQTIRRHRRKMCNCWNDNDA